MSTPATLPKTKPIRGTIPPLEHGDQLTSREFERRCNAMPDLKKAELLDGEVFMGSPARLNLHGRPHAAVITWLGTYSARTPRTIVGDNSTLRLDDENEPQPDVVLLIHPGGQANVDKEDYITGPPELAVEVATSSVSYDMHRKLRIYRRFGVREYLIWRVSDGELDWFVLRGADYEPLASGDDDLLRSAAFPGLWLDAAALLAGDLARVDDVVRLGLASPEHAAFVQELAAR